MEVVNFRPQRTANSVLALFDIDLECGLRLLNWRLHRAADGVLTSYPPTAKGGTPSAKAPLTVREAITAAAAGHMNTAGAL